MSEVLTLDGWTAVPGTHGGYDIYSPGFGNQLARYRGHAPKKEQALEWLDEASGVAYKRLPTIRLDDLRREIGNKNARTDRLPGWCQITVYYLGEKFLGSIQTKCSRKQARESYDFLTCVGDRCVFGADLSWLLKENGFRLLPDSCV